MPKDLLWKPRRRGRIYCSPACGYGCTVAAYNIAIRDAAAVHRKLTRMFGGVWEKQIWENMGWYAAVASGGLTVHINRSPFFGLSFTTLFNRDGENFGGGNPGFTVNKSFDSAGQAVRAQIAVIQSRNKQELELIANMQRWLAVVDVKSKGKR